MRQFTRSEKTGRSFKEVRVVSEISGSHPVDSVNLDSIVEVEWVDSERIFLGWAERKDYTAALVDRTTYRTTGYLINQTPDHVLLVMNYSDSGLVGEGMVVPRACIKAITVLRPSTAEATE